MQDCGPQNIKTNWLGLRRGGGEGRDVIVNLFCTDFAQAAGHVRTSQHTHLAQQEKPEH